MNLIGIQQWGLFERQPHSVSNPIIIVLLGRDNSETVEHIRAARDPSGKNTCQTLVQEAGHAAFKEYFAVIDENLDIARFLSHRFFENLEFPTDFLTDRAVNKPRIPT